MKKLLFLFFILPAIAFAQDLKLSNATVQTINHGAAPIANVNYLLLLKKDKSFIWSIDSVYSIADNKKVNFNIVKVDDPNLPSPRYEKLDKFEKKYKGLIQLSFSSMKSMGEEGRPHGPKIVVVESNDYTAGVKIFYTVRKKKQKILQIESFEKLETINAP